MPLTASRCCFSPRRGDCLFLTWLTRNHHGAGFWDKFQSPLRGLSIFLTWYPDRGDSSGDLRISVPSGGIVYFLLVLSFVYALTMLIKSQSPQWGLFISYQFIGWEFDSRPATFQSPQRGLLISYLALCHSGESKQVSVPFAKHPVKGSGDCLFLTLMRIRLANGNARTGFNPLSGDYLHQ